MYWHTTFLQPNRQDMDIKCSVISMAEASKYEGLKEGKYRSASIFSPSEKTFSMQKPAPEHVLDLTRSRGDAAHHHVLWRMSWY